VPCNKKGCSLPSAPIVTNFLGFCFEDTTFKTGLNDFIVIVDLFDLYVQS